MPASWRAFYCLATLVIGALFVTGCRDRGDTDSMTYEGLVHSFQADKVGVDVIEFSPDERSFFTGGAEGVKQWDAKSFKLIRHGRLDVDGTGSANAVLALAADPNQPLLYMGLSGSKDVEIWNYQTNELVGSIPTRERWCEWVNALAISPDGSLLAVAENGAMTKENEESSGDRFSVLIWDLKQKQLKARLTELPQNVTDLKFSEDGSKLMGDSSYASVIWNVQTGAVVGAFGRLNHEPRLEIEATHCVVLTSKAGQNQNAIVETDPAGTAETSVVEASSRIELIVESGFARPSTMRIRGTDKGTLEFGDLESNTVWNEIVQFTNGEGVNAVAATSDGTVVISGGDGLALGGVGVSVDQRFRQVCVWKVEIE